MNKFKFHVREGINPLGPRIDFEIHSGETVTEYSLYQTDGIATGVYT